MFILLYADDTVILAESHTDLQAALDAMLDYCNTWDLKVNASKTKIIVFCKSKKTLSKESDFYYNGEKVDIVEEFVYLGVLFSFNGKFAKTKKRLIVQARKAMFALIKKCRKLNLAFSLQLHLFNSMIVPILLYGSEVWAFEDMKILDQFQLNFCKIVLNLKKSTPNCMIYGELGIKPVSQQAISRLLCFWGKLVFDANVRPSKICNIVYKTIYVLHNDDIIKLPWLSFVESTLNDLGLNDVFTLQHVTNVKNFKNLIKCRLADQFIQNWQSSVNNSSKCSVYRIYKKDFHFEDYLDILPKCLALSLLKFRVMNHKFPVEFGRFQNIDRSQRTCHLCTSNVLGDEFHYLFQCKYFLTDRKKYIKKYFFQHSNCYKLDQLMNSKNKKELVSLATFCKSLLSHFK